MHRVALTIPEACRILKPPMTEQQLRAILRAFRIEPCGTRRDGHVGRPAPTWDWAEITRLHAALSPWLNPQVTARN